MRAPQTGAPVSAAFTAFITSWVFSVGSLFHSRAQRMCLLFVFALRAGQSLEGTPGQAAIWLVALWVCFWKSHPHTMVQGSEWPRAWASPTAFLLRHVLEISQCSEQHWAKGSPTEKLASGKKPSKTKLGLLRGLGPFQKVVGIQSFDF